MIEQKKLSSLKLFDARQELSLAGIFLGKSCINKAYNKIVSPQN